MAFLETLNYLFEIDCDLDLPVLFAISNYDYIVPIYDSIWKDIFLKIVNFLHFNNVSQNSIWNEKN